VRDVTANYALLAVYAPLIAGSLVAFAADAFASRRIALGASALGLLIAAVAGLAAGVLVPVADVASVLRVGGPFSSVPGVIALCGALALLGGWNGLAQREGGGTTAGLYALAAGAAGVVSAAVDLTTLLIAIEIVALVSYALVSEGRTTRSDEAAMKYFIQGSVATGFFVLGMAVLVGLFAPTGHYAQLVTTLGDAALGDPAMVGVVLIVAALAFKAAIAPLHMWAPDAYETAPIPSSAFLATGPKLGAVFALVIFASVAGGSLKSVALVPLLLALSVTSVLVGSIGALGQKSYRRMLAYAGIAQVGYALLAVAMLDPTSAAFFMSTYAIATAGAFLAAETFQRIDPTWDGTISGLAGMGRRAPLTSAAVSVLLVSLVGIPPMLGFWGKFQVFATAIYGSAAAFLGGGSALVGWLLAIAVGVGLVGSVISLGYYGSVLRALYLLPPVSTPADQASAEKGSERPSVILLLVAVAVFALGIAPAVWGYSVLILPFVSR